MKRYSGLRRKVFIILLCLNVIPLSILGISTNLIIAGQLKNKLYSLANQTIENLSLYISKEIKAYLSLAFYCSSNYKIGSTLEKHTPVNLRETFYLIRRAVTESDLVRQVNYPYHYIILARDGTVFTNFSYSLGNLYEDVRYKLSNEPWYNELQESYVRKFKLTTEENFLNTGGGKQLYIAVNIPYNFENQGVALIGVNGYFISRLLENAKLSTGSSLFLMNSSREFLLAGEGNSIDFESLHEVISTMSVEQLMGAEKVPVRGEPFLFNIKRLILSELDEDLYILMLTPMAEVLRDVNKINVVFIIIVSLCLVALAVVSIFMDRFILKPIINLNDLMMEVSRNNLDVSAPEDGMDEIGRLGVGFNHMVRNLRSYIASIEEKEESKRALEVGLLQTQLNPHFIKNTLNILRWIAELKKMPGLSKAVISCSKLVSYNFITTEYLTTVREEIEYLKEYIYLQKLRYQNKYSISIEIDDCLWDRKILRFSLQPILENAIVHGFKGKKGISRIRISGKAEDHATVFKIWDNGIGMSQEKIRQVLSDNSSSTGNGNSIGLKNVNQRIKLHFGAEYGVSITGIPGEGLEVTLYLPDLR